MNKDAVGCVIPIVVIGGLFVWAYLAGAEKREAKKRERTTREAEERHRETEETQRKEIANQTFKDLAERHNAERISSFYTLELQDTLSKHGNRAIFVCRIDDVLKMGDGFRIVSRSDSYSRPMTLLLEADEATARHVCDNWLHWTRPSQAFAVVVVVKRVTVTLRREYYALGNDEMDVEIVEEGGMFPQVVITGKCLEIVRLEGDVP